MISIPRGTEMCQFSRLPSAGYVFTDGRRRITGAGFPHSEIRGSMAVQRLTAAYRSRPRPSSTPGAKASTMCPYSLDGELHPRHEGEDGANTLLLALVQFSSSAEAGLRRSSARGLSKLSSAPKRRHRAQGSAAAAARSGRRFRKRPRAAQTGGPIGASP